MAKKKEKGLPHEQYGNGSWAWKDNNHTILYYRKRYKDSKGAYHSLMAVQMQGEDADAMRNRIKAKEEAIENKIANTFVHSVDNPSVTLVDAIGHYIKEEIADRKETSQDRTERTLNNQIDKHPIGMMRVPDITEENLKVYFNTLKEEKNKWNKPLSYSSIKKAYNLLHRFFAWYYKNDINHNPMNGISCPKKSTLPDAEEGKFDDSIVLTDEEIETYKSECYKPVEVGKRGSKYDIGTYFILLMCLRVGEALALKWKDINIEEKKLTINKSTARINSRDPAAEGKTQVITRVPKTKNSNRTLFMSDEAVQTIRDYKAICKHTGRDDYVFATATGKQVEANKVLKAVKNIIKNAGLNKDGERDKFTTHYLRHTGISFYIRNGIDISVISRMAGHASVAITQNVYYHVIADQQKEGVDAMNAIFAKNKQSAAGVNKTDAKV